MSKSKQGSTVIILILGALTTVSPFSIDMYLPAFSQIAKGFATTPAKISFSVTSYFIGLAIGQLVYGPLLDRFGRKRPLYIGLVIFIIACLGCAKSQNIEMLVAFRFIQALGGCVAQVASVAMVRDFFPVKQSARVFSLMMLILGLSPLLAPTAGGFVASSLGWQWVFVLLALVVLIILIITFIFLPATVPPDPTVSLRATPMASNFYKVLRVSQFRKYAFSGAFSFATMFIYVAGSPVIFMEIFHLSPQAYGGIFALLSVGFIGGNQLNILLLKKFKSEQIYFLALLFQLTTAIVLLVSSYYHWYDLVSTVILFFISLSCLGLTYPNAAALSLAPITKNVGTASALMGFIQIGVAGLTSASIGLFNARDSVPVAFMFVCTSMVAIIILIAGGKRVITIL